MYNEHLDQESYAVNFNLSMEQSLKWSNVAENFFSQVQMYVLDSAATQPVFYSILRRETHTWTKDETSLDLDCEAIREVIKNVLMQHETFGVLEKYYNGY